MQLFVCFSRIKTLLNLLLLLFKYEDGEEKKVVMHFSFSLENKPNVQIQCDFSYCLLFHWQNSFLLDSHIQCDVLIYILMLDELIVLGLPENSETENKNLFSSLSEIVEAWWSI